ncbi:MAG: hypothetical protein HC873_22770 [Leptolyngbyaceae cyanobacterium SL_1_1]|nr:hypothetical protein [Leptolyngbyaceae cyanobacterium SL_1_1]
MDLEKHSLRRSPEGSGFWQRPLGPQTAGKIVPPEADTLPQIGISQTLSGSQSAILGPSQPRLLGLTPLAAASLPPIPTRPDLVQPTLVLTSVAPSVAPASPIPASAAVVPSQSVLPALPNLLASPPRPSLLIEPTADINPQFTTADRTRTVATVVDTVMTQGATAPLPDSLASPETPESVLGVPLRRTPAPLQGLAPETVPVVELSGNRHSDPALVEDTVSRRGVPDKISVNEQDEQRDRQPIAVAAPRPLLPGLNSSERKPLELSYSEILRLNLPGSEQASTQCRLSALGLESLAEPSDPESVVTELPGGCVSENTALAQTPTSEVRSQDFSEVVDD